MQRSIGAFLKSSKSILLVCTFCFGSLLSAGPARRGTIQVKQPDGTIISAVMKGDEYYHVLTDLQGRALVQDESGYFCYARYEADGTKVSTGYRADKTAPDAVISQSMLIPHELLLNSAREKRMIEDEKANATIIPLSVKQNDASKGIHKKCIVLLASFADYPMTYTHEHFINLFTQDNYDFEGAKGSVKKYYTDQFGDDCSFEFTVAPIVTLSQNRSYYGSNNDRNASQAVSEACKLSDDVVDFSRFDSDGDGVVDNVFLIVAGTDEAESGEDAAIWGHKSSINLSLDGVRLNTYNLCSELAWRIQLGKFSFTTIGALCHEFGHTLTLKDMYDCDGESSGGKSEAMNKTTALMDNGCYNDDCKTPAHFNAVDYDRVGYGDCQELTPGSYTLQPISKERKYYKVSCPTNEGEHFLIECRDNTGYDYYIQGKGLAIYHIDRSNKNFESGRGATGASRWNSNTVNNNPAHQCADMIEPNTVDPVAESAFFPWNNIRSYSPVTNPAFKFWDGSSSPLSISDIKINEDGSVSFKVHDNSTYLIPKVEIVGKDIYQNKARLVFRCSLDSSSPTAKVKWGPKGGNLKEETLSPNEDGEYILMMEGLTPGADYTATVLIDLGADIKTDETDCSYTTTPIDKHGETFIFFGNVARNDDGSFAAGTGIPMVVFNTVDYKDVKWYMDGKQIYASKNGMYILTQSGTLKAVIRYKDGDTETIIKHITVK